MMQMIEGLGQRMITKMRMVNLYGMSGNKFSHELRGMQDAMKAMGIEYSFEYNDEVTQFTAVVIAGTRFSI